MIMNYDDNYRAVASAENAPNTTSLASTVAAPSQAIVIMIVATAPLDNAAPAIPYEWATIRRLSSDYDHVASYVAAKSAVGSNVV